MTRKGPKSDIFFGTNDRLTYFLMQFQKKKRPERKAQIAVFPTYCDFFFNVDVLKKLCVMGIFFLTKLTKIPIYRLEKKAARQISGRIEKKIWDHLIFIPWGSTQETHLKNEEGSYFFKISKSIRWWSNLWRPGQIQVRCESNSNSRSQEFHQLTAPRVFVRQAMSWIPSLRPMLIATFATASRRLLTVSFDPLSDARSAHHLAAPSVSSKIYSAAPRVCLSPTENNSNKSNEKWLSPNRRSGKN